MNTPEIITTAARKLRKDMTYSEKLIWAQLKACQRWIKIYRQKPIFVWRENNWLERYIIADFYFPDKKLIIEIDWSIHDDKRIYQLDRIKESLLKKRWFHIIRFYNDDVNSNLEATIHKIITPFSS